MDTWLVIVTKALLVMLASMALLRMNKMLRGQRGALTQKLNLDDLLVLGAMAVMGSLFSEQLPLGFNVGLFLILALYGFLVWLDAILFVQYRIEVNRQTVAWFLSGSKGLAKGLPHLLAVFKKYPIGISIPLIWFMLLYCWLLNDNDGLLTQVFLLALLVSAIGVLMQSLNVIAIALLVAGTVIIWNVPVDRITTGIYLLGSIGASILSFLLLLLVLMRHLFQSQHEFLTSPTLLSNIIADDRFIANDDVVLDTAHQAFVSVPASKQDKSDLFGKCAGANIILITVESLGTYINPYTQEAAHSRIAEKLASKSWLSRQHFCLCPNTTVSTNQMYTGAYSNNPYNKDESLFPGTEPQHIQHLKKSGYKTLFLDSANIELYDYRKLLERIGFDKVWGTDDIPSNGLSGDYRLWNMVDSVVEEVGEKPFFLHVINDQTHMPYEVIDGERFNRHKGKDAKATYLNAMEEVDYILDTFLERLGEKLDLSNTVLVFTGDHGESFGEFGYSFHSNSVILPQMQVPFMLHHPKLQARQINHSCHFDLFPTFFDLLGIDYQHQCIGSSLANNDRAFSYLFHSATLKGNTPANFGFLHNGEMFWVDRLFNQISVLQQDNTKVAAKHGEKEYIRTMLHRMLKQRGILV
jgi:phosphoglycerol transferase MdoB-like AlkP superfamily enzyme